jgi:hypothetical protein
VGRAVVLLREMAGVAASTGWMAGIRGRAAALVADSGFTDRVRELLKTAPAVHADEAPSRRLADWRAGHGGGQGRGHEAVWSPVGTVVFNGRKTSSCEPAGACTSGGVASSCGGLLPLAFAALAFVFGPAIYNPPYTTRSPTVGRRLHKTAAARSRPACCGPAVS